MLAERYNSLAEARDRKLPSQSSAESIAAEAIDRGIAEPEAAGGPTARSAKRGM
jgi:hypothetical protein